MVSHGYEDSSRRLRWRAKKVGELPRLRMLYLASYAPASSDDAMSTLPDLHAEDGIFPRYHWEIYRILKKLGFKLISTRSHDILIQKAATVDYVFSLYNRASFRNPETFMSGLCEYLGVPYLGAAPSIRAVAEDKHLAKIYFNYLGIPSPHWTLVDTSEAGCVQEFEGPYLVKPRMGCASRGISAESVKHTWKEAVQDARKVAELEGGALIEEFIDGENVTVPLVGGDPPIILPPMRALSSIDGNLETYEQKRKLMGGLSREIYRDARKARLVVDIALKIFLEFRDLDYLRVDFRVPPEGPPLALEFNICCNLGSHSTVATPARKIGVSQQELIGAILFHSFYRQGVMANPANP